MKTNMLFVCEYCDKKLGSKRTVKMHINNLHQQDPENPLMYHSILVSPKDVNNLLGRLSRDQAADTPIIPKVPEGNVDSGNLERVTGNHPENVCGSDVNHKNVITVDTEENVLSVEPSENVSTTPSVQVKNSTLIPLEKVSVDPCKKKPKRVKKVKVKKEQTPCYDYRRLANIFNTPELVDITSSEESEPSSSHLAPTTGQDEDTSSSGRGRTKFKVPYKRPRGKCADWEHCINCSLDSDCGDCRHCLDKSLR